jgi:hypothetical protein
MYQLPYTQNEERTSVSTKCNTCKEITPQEFIKITPFSDDPDIKALTLLELTKRLVICTQCGNLRLIN